MFTNPGSIVAKLRLGLLAILSVTVSFQSFGQGVPPPTVHEDGSVTFRRLAPDAKKVLIVLETKLAPIALTKTDNGVWSYKTEPLPPDIYAYHFLIDGEPTGDPANEMKLPVVSGGAQGLVHIPGPKTLPWERGNEATGKIESFEYESKVIGETRKLNIYLPPGYQFNGKQKYPVLYLLHGVMGDEHSWIAAGRANVILDKLIGSNESEPMIVVMPQGYGFANAKERVNEIFGPMNHKEWMQRFAESLVTEIIPSIEAKYAIRSKREARAIAGLSMGGAQALFIGLNYPETFGYIRSMSSAFMLYGGKNDSFLGGAKKTNEKMRPDIWITTGTQDFVYAPNKQVVAWLKDNGIAATFHETPGGHTWGVWRRGLAKFAPNLFRTK